MSSSNRSKAAIIDVLLPNSGTIGYILLLSGSVQTGVTITLDNSGNTATTSGNHLLVTGSRIRLAVSGGSLPSELASYTATDVWIIKDSDTVFKFASSLANAEAGTEIDFSSNGSGTITFNEQVLAGSDRKEVKINKELSHASYSRKAITNIGAASVDTGQKPGVTVTWSVTGSAMSFRYILIVRGATSTIADTTGDWEGMIDEGSTQTVDPGNTLSRTIVLPGYSAAT